MGAAIGMNTEDLFNDEDLDYSPSAVSLVNKQPVGKTLGCLTARNNIVGLIYFIESFGLEQTFKIIAFNHNIAKSTKFVLLWL